MTHYDSQLPVQAAAGSPAPEAPAMQPVVQDALEPQSFYGTPIWTRTLTAHETINPPLIESLKRIEATTSAIKRSNVGGWHSEINLQRHPDFVPLSRIIAQVVRRCVLSLDYDFERGQLNFQSMWANRNGQNDYNASHVHPNAFLSGSYYLAVPPDGGNIEFSDPVRERVMMPVPIKPGSPKHTKRIEFKCRSGMLIIFPSWLTHAVQPNRSADARYSLAFNVTSSGRQPPAC
ncbi:MAG: TIGR02466 family protein [Parvibaculaceae bacterium]